MKIKTLHPWPRTTTAAIALQQRLAADVRLCPVRGSLRIIAGIDAAFSRDGRHVIAGVVAWDLQEHEVVETRIGRAVLRFPYVPGLLTFRELPAVLAALRKLRTIPDIVLCDAQGLAHPRGVGLACHLGLWLERPTIGCAKSRLCGDFDLPGSAKGSASPLHFRGRRVGTVLRTRDGVRPLFVSPGHLCDVRSAVRLTLAAVTRYRLPEPTRLAHQLVTAAR